MITARSARVMMLTALFLSFMLMFFDFSISANENIFFYAVAYAALLFRVFGVWCITITLHILTYVFIAMVMFNLDRDMTNVTNMYFCLIPMLVVILIAVHLLLAFPGGSAGERAFRTGIHALTGIIAVIVYFWTICFYIQFNPTKCIIEMMYMLLWLFILLTPYFTDETQAIALARAECELESLKSLRCRKVIAEAKKRKAIREAERRDVRRCRAFINQQLPEQKLEKERLLKERRLKGEKLDCLCSRQGNQGVDAAGASKHRHRSKSHHRDDVDYEFTRPSRHNLARRGKSEPDEDEFLMETKSLKRHESKHRKAYDMHDDVDRRNMRHRPYDDERDNYDEPSTSRKETCGSRKKQKREDCEFRNLQELVCDEDDKKGDKKSKKKCAEQESDIESEFSDESDDRSKKSNDNKKSGKCPCSVDFAEEVSDEKGKKSKKTKDNKVKSPDRASGKCPCSMHLDQEVSDDKAKKPKKSKDSKKCTENYSDTGSVDSDPHQYDKKPIPKKSKETKKGQQSSGSGSCSPYMSDIENYPTRARRSQSQAADNEMSRPEELSRAQSHSPDRCRGYKQKR